VLGAQRARFEGTGANPKLTELPRYRLPERSGAPTMFDGSDGPTVTSIRQKSDQAKQSMQSHERHAVYGFTGNDYRNVRSSEQDHRSGKGAGHLLPLGERGIQAQEIDSALKKAAENGHTVQGLELWRGVGRIPKSTIEQYLTTGEFQHWGTASTSRSLDIASNFDALVTKNGVPISHEADSHGYGVVYRMKNKTAVPIETLSRIPGEHEFLARAGARYKVTNAYWGSDSVLILEGEEI
jgi:hypothetical protein